MKRRIKKSKILKMLDFIFNYSPPPSYYGSLLIFASFPLILISTYLSFVRDYEENIQKWASFREKNNNTAKRAMETILSIQYYPYRHPGRFLFVAFLFWIGVVLDVTYMISDIFMISNILWVGKFSFLVVFIASLMVFLLMLMMAREFLRVKIITAREFLRVKIRHWYPKILFLKKRIRKVFRVKIKN